MRNIQQSASQKSKALIEAILAKKPDLGKVQKTFICSILLLFLSLRGRYNFLGMARYGNYSEKTYRKHFEQPFDFLWFNKTLCTKSCSKDLVIAFDPSYLPKSGKKTPNVDTFWSGCLGKATKGLEIGGLGLVDIENKTAMSLEAIPTPDRKSLEEQGLGLTSHYAKVFIDREEQLLEYSNIAVVDAYFTKKDFVDAICEVTDLHLVGKLRKDAHLQYLYDGPRRKGPGRPKKYDGKVDLSQLNKKYWFRCHEDEEVLIHQAVLWSVSLKRKIKVAYVQFKDEKGQLTNRYVLYFSTEIELDGLKIFQYYKARFQIEFLFRDAKQHTGLTHCQARSSNKLYFHFNLALTAVNVAKAAHYLSIKKQERKSFSLATIKTLYLNELMLNLFIANFQIDPNEEKNQPIILKLLNIGTIAA